MNGLISRSEGVATQILKLYLPTIPRLHTNGTDTMKKTFIACAIFTALVLFLIPGCTEDTVSVPPGFNVSSVSVSVAPNGDIIVTISGGTTPYSITAASDTTVATTSVAGGSLNIHGVSGGFTTVTVGDAASASATITIVVTGAITADLFPLVMGNKYTYGGYAIAPSTGTIFPDPSNRYQTVWTIGPAGPLPGSTVIIDSTRLVHPSIGEILVARNLVILKNNITGEFFFLQTLGPFFRAFGINRTDTVRSIPIARPEVGIGGSWTAFDSTYTDSTASTIRLQIFGEVEAGEVITDSAAAHGTHETVRFRTWRRITLNGTIVVDNATTSKLWLQRIFGPVQLLIAEDTENIGHFRVLAEGR